MIIYVDIDNTICVTHGTDYANAIPNNDNIKKVNELSKNHTIVMWTARGSLSNNNYFKLTFDQLQTWGVKFNELRMGKPAFDLFIDDKVLNSIHHWDEINVNRFVNKNI